LEQTIARLQEQVKTLFSDMDELKGDIKVIKDDLSKRPPVWATALIALLTAAVGWLAN